MDRARDLLRRLFQAAVAAADPTRALTPHMPAPPRGRTVVVGAGKGAAQLAAAFEALWDARNPDAPLQGVVVTRYGYGAPTRRVRVMEAAHPAPDDAGLAASAALRDAVAGLGPDDLVVALVCGGGSALLPAPAPGLTMADEIAVNAALLSSGAPIGAMNAVRAQLSTIKAGRLALAAHPAPVLSLVVSDIPGDDPALVASGPTVAGPASREAARDAVARWRIALPEAAAALLAGKDNPAPDPDDPRLAGCRTVVVASAARSLEAAAAQAADEGLRAVILSDAMEGEARVVAGVHAAMAREIAARGRPFAAPVLMLSGGETTVTLAGPGGRGGRNGEFALAMATALAGLPVAALAADTDGIDGSQDNAGAFVDGTTAARLTARGLSAAALLDAHDSWGAFDALGDLFVTGPTGTNVNDFRAILVDPALAAG